jgi:pyruvate dehydrogenase E2 component (dihydrolipoamide acetyltransferase)
VVGVATAETEAAAGPPRESAAPEGVSPESADAPPDGRLKASPVARRIAAESGIDLGAITGSGPGGRIVKADVEAALAGVASAPPAGAPAAPAPPGEASAVSPPAAVQPVPPTAPPTGLTARVEEASQMRKAIARRLVESIGPVPHFFLTTEIDMGRALALRAELNERWRDGKIGVNDVLLKATAEALNRHPEVNASWGGDSIVYHGSVDLGIAVAIDGGLITPVLRDAGRKGLRQISLEARALIERARTRKLVPEEYEGSTFSVSNLGMYEIDQFTAIINPPESGILAVGATVEKPVVVEGEVVVRKRMRVTMSCDHRVVDGATGAAFLGTFKAMLENPLEMIL